MKPGEVYWADLEFAGRHPVIVLSREELNRGNTVVAIPCTSQNFEKRSKLPNCVPFQAGEFGFNKPTVAQCENVQIVERQILDPTPIGVVGDEALRDIVRALGYVVDADCEPREAP